MPDLVGLSIAEYRTVLIRWIGIGRFKCGFENLTKDTLLWLGKLPLEPSRDLKETNKLKQRVADSRKSMINVKSSRQTEQGFGSNGSL